MVHRIAVLNSLVFRFNRKLISRLFLAIENMQLIDSHAHIDASVFDADRDVVLAQARKAGVVMQLVPATALSGWHKLRDICSEHADLIPAYGFHPMYLEQHKPEDLNSLRVWIECEKPSLVGECGLDFFMRDLDQQMQRFYFQAQLKLAKEYDLALIIHARRAVDEVIYNLRRLAPLRGIIHSFSGSVEQARQLWNLGFLIGIGGPITYQRATRLRHIVQHMPLDFLALETDSPDQPGSGCQGQRNEPANLLDVLNEIAELRATSPEKLALVTTQNVLRMLRLNGNS